MFGLPGRTDLHRFSGPKLLHFSAGVQQVEKAVPFGGRYHKGVSAPATVSLEQEGADSKLVGAVSPGCMISSNDLFMNSYQ